MTLMGTEQQHYKGRESLVSFPALFFSIGVKEGCSYGYRFVRDHILEFPVLEMEPETAQIFWG